MTTRFSALVARPLGLASGLVLACGLSVACSTAPPARDPASLASAYLEVGRLREATREIELAVRSQPRDVELRLRAADIHDAAGNLERAIGHLEMALQVSPTSPEISIRLGELERGRDNLPDAYVAFKRAAQLAPTDLRAVSGWALAAEALGFREEADDAYALWAEAERVQGVRP